MSKRIMYERVVCKSGFTMSVQAHAAGYCTPRENNAERYTSVEVGFPSKLEPMLMEFAEEPAHPTETVYGYVPVQIVTNVIVKHGGMIEGTAPPGVVQLWFHE